MLFRSRVWLPKIEGPVLLADACSRPGAAVADPAGAPLAAPGTAPSLVIIGPEGGFDDGELPASVARVSLGGTILRAETATLVAATLLADMRNRKEASR